MPRLRQLYELTGPRAISFPEALDRIAAATRRDIRLLRVPAADYRAELARQQVPDVEADLVLYLLTTVLDGRNEHTTDSVQRALGRPPRDFTDYVRRTAASGVWSA